MVGLETAALCFTDPASARDRSSALSPQLGDSFSCPLLETLLREYAPPDNIVDGRDVEKSKTHTLPFPVEHKSNEPEQKRKSRRGAESDGVPR